MLEVKAVVTLGERGDWKKIIKTFLSVDNVPFLDLDTSYILMRIHQA